MLIINKVKLYNIEINDVPLVKSDIEFELVGNENSNIICFVHTELKLLDSKDYKLLTKVFEKLKRNISNILVINVNTCKASDYDLIMNIFKIKNLIIFGTNTFVTSIPITFQLNTIYQQKSMKILCTDSLSNITNSLDDEYKKECWNIIKQFFAIN